MKNTLLTFDTILQNAHNQVGVMPQSKQEELTDALEHGQGQLKTKEQLLMYLHKYGEIHQTKLKQAFAHVPAKLWLEGSISIVDYGCGQGIAEMVLSDYLHGMNVDSDIIKDITLIEPSRISLVQATTYLSRFYVDAKVNPLAITASELLQDDIKPKSNCVLHILSNVLDLEDFNFKPIADILKRDVSHNNVVICVSPFYQENSRGKRMDQFGNQLKGYSCVYRFQKHIDDWDNDYSCQIRIFISSYY